MGGIKFILGFLILSLVSSQIIAQSKKDIKRKLNSKIDSSVSLTYREYQSMYGDDCHPFNVLPLVGLSGGKLFGEVGISFCPYMEFEPFDPTPCDRFPKRLTRNFYLSAATEFNFRDPFIMGPKLSFHYRYMFWEGGVNMIGYTNFAHVSYMARPEVGINLFDIGIHYGYNIRITEIESLDPYINKHQFTVFIRIR